MIRAALAVVALQTGATAPAAVPEYVSPYSLAFATPKGELTADFALAPRADAHDASDVAYEQWYGAEVRRKFNAWGPRPRLYPAPERIDERDVVWRRERVIASAERLIGYAYQHHHVPDWDPPQDWDWKPTCAGRNGKGLDCSNFTTFVYDYALGIRFTSEVGEQATLRTVKGFGGDGEIAVERIERGDSYRAFVDRLATADLVFVKDRAGELSHVVLWLGSTGHSTDGTPVVIDSHGETVKDARGETIPCGIQIRPFREDSWYWRSASHALRIVKPPANAHVTR